MGNCSARGVSHLPANELNLIRIVTHSGEILKFEGPKSVGDVLIAFPGHKIFGQGHASLPLFDHQHLVGGKSYYLLPSETRYDRCMGDLKVTQDGNNLRDPLKSGDELIAPKLVSNSEANDKEPVRMSSAALEIVTSLASGSGLQVLEPKQKGVWRVKLAISPRQLEEILAEEINTEALIEQMSMAAATSTCLTPKRRKISWGLMCKPVLASALKFAIQSPKQVESNGKESEVA